MEWNRKKFFILFLTFIRFSLCWVTSVHLQLVILLPSFRMRKLLLFYSYLNWTVIWNLWWVKILISAPINIIKLVNYVLNWNDVYAFNCMKRLILQFALTSVPYSIQFGMWRVCLSDCFTHTDTHKHRLSSFCIVSLRSFDILRTSIKIQYYYLFAFFFL